MGSEMIDRPPSRAGKDERYAVSKALVGSAPIVGHALTVLMERVFTPPIEKRRERWFEMVADAIAELQLGAPARSLDALKEDEQFVTIVTQATQIAIRNHQQAKLDALKQALLHSAGPNPPSEDKQLLFLRFVDELTPSHIKVLAAARIRENTNNPYSKRVYDRVPGLRSDEQFIKTLIYELQARALLWNPEDHNFPGKPNAVGGAPRLADEFLSYIGIPEHDYTPRG